MKWKVWPNMNALKSSVQMKFGTQAYRRFKDAFQELLHYMLFFFFTRSGNFEISWKRKAFEWYFILLEKIKSYIIKAS